jgi:hypothetical protein
MTTKCDFCKRDLRYIYARSYCGCGKITCSKSCHKYTRVLIEAGGNYNYVSVCNDEILKSGKRGFIKYDHYTNKGCGKAIMKDPNYEPMLDELKQLREKVAQLSVENQSLKIQIECAPGGTEYLSAKERFDTQNY